MINSNGLRYELDGTEFNVTNLESKNNENDNHQINVDTQPT